MPRGITKETGESAFEDFEDRERDRKYRQLVADTSRIDFPFDPANVGNALDFFLDQYPQYARPLADPVVLIEKANKWGHTFLIEAGTAPNRSLRLVYARRMEDFNIPRTKINFQPDLLDLLFLFNPDYEKLTAYTKISRDEICGDDDYREIAEFLIINCPEAVLTLIKQLPVRCSNAFTVRTASPQPYLDAGFEDLKKLVYGLNPFQAENED